MNNINYLYRLRAIQVIKGVELAIYIKEDKFPDTEVLTDAIELIYGLNTVGELMMLKPNFYNLEKRKHQLIILKNKLNKSKKILEQYNNIEKCIFVESFKFEDWHGQQNLYKNDHLEIYKSSYPEFSGCTYLRKIYL